ncbi:MAG: succinate dehydrogenase, hydrophobic membrane anchor protein [Acidimicrobiia bacterium]
MAQTLDSTETGTEGGAQTRVANRSEVRMWYYMRISGLILVFLALAHFAITHIVNDVVETDYLFVQTRWSNPLWRFFDWALLTLALSHGAIGVRAISEDYIRNRRLRVGVKALLFTVVGGLFLLGTITIVTFSA